MKIVRFLKNDLPYLKGEIAGFHVQRADHLIALGVAELYGDGMPKKVGGRLPPQPGEFGWEPPKAGKAA
jgi:hypothetical protein